MSSESLGKLFAHECRIRDFYATELAAQRPAEKLIRTEPRYETSLLRADMRTIDRANTLREWEFKIRADYKALGQILIYLALARLENDVDCHVQGVLAAFEFTEEVRLANRMLNLGIELVEIPVWMRQAGGIPEVLSSAQVVKIPSVASAVMPAETK